MFARASVAVCLVTATAVAMLALRHHRFEAMHEMARLHRQVNTTRQTLWDAQTQIAQGLKPEVMLQVIRQADLKLDPLADELPPPPRLQSVDRGNSEPAAIIND